MQYFQGERLSHAVGCAFSICLEKKKRRDEETAQVNVQSAQESTSSTPPKDIFHPNWEDNTSEGTSTQNPSNSRSNLAYQSFRKHVSIEDRYLDPQSVIINEVPASNHMDEIRRISKPRPTGNPALFLRQVRFLWCQVVPCEIRAAKTRFSAKNSYF